MNKNEVCCFSGHRPSDLPWKEINKYMIENSSAILAVYNGKKYGGTYQTLRMAKAARLKIFAIKP